MTGNPISGLINGILNRNMKISTVFKLKVLPLLLLIFSAGNLFSQNPGNPVAPSERKCQEQLAIITDRDIYITGERVWLKVSQVNIDKKSPSVISRIIYIELLDALNNPVFQLKIQTDGSSGFSDFRLPDDLTSGSYLLRAYTGWMQNFSPDEYAYKTISIINPFTGIISLIPGPGQSFSPGYQKSINSGKANPRADVAGNTNALDIKITSDKPGYGTREKIKIGISIADREGNPVNADLSVSVVKSIFQTGEGNKPPRSSSGGGNPFLSASVTSYLAEPEGILIRGVMKNKETDQPLKNIDISLSFVGKSARCMFAKTNSKGEFLFVGRDIYGLNEIVIQPLVKSDSASYAELNQPFSRYFNDYKPAGFFPDSSLIGEINNAIIAMQVSAIYDPLNAKKNVIAGSQIKDDFYGDPSGSIKLADYIELTDVREVIKEIIPMVVPGRQGKGYNLRVVNKNPYEEFKDQALVLVDGVPFYDVGELMNMRANKLESADFINTRFFYNGYIFYGIVSFVTKKGNLSAFEFDDSVYRRVFEGCQPAQEFFSPDYSVDSLRISRFPDFRNTLFWDPAIRISSGGKTDVEFYTSDETGDYTIVLQGIDREGIQVYFASPLIVR
jgi:hypothetical protein